MPYARIPCTDNQAYQAKRSLESASGQDHYTLEGAWSFPCRLDVAALLRAAEQLMALHPFLRARLSADSETVSLNVAQSAFSPPVCIFEFEQEFEDIQGAVKVAHAMRERRLDLVGNSVWDLSLTLSASSSVLLLRASHVVCDRLSWAVLCEHISRAYTGLSLPRAATIEETADFSTKSLKRRQQVSAIALRERATQLLEARMPTVDTMQEVDPEPYYSQSTRLRVSNEHLGMSARTARTTVMGYLLQATAQAWKAQKLPYPMLVAVPVSNRPKGTFSDSLGDYTNMALILLEEDVAHSPKACFAAMTDGLRWASVHVTDLSIAMCVEDAARFRVDYDGNGSKAFILAGMHERTLSLREPTTRRDFAVSLTAVSAGGLELSTSRRKGYSGVHEAMMLNGIAGWLDSTPSDQV